MSGVIEAAGLTPAEVDAFLKYDTVWLTDEPIDSGALKLCMAIRSEHAARPIERGDVVRIPFAPTDTFEVRCVEDDEAWVLDVKSGGRLTVKLDCIERVQP